jgi:hypothetical protein
VDAFDERARSVMVTRLRELIAIGRSYDLFAQNDPSQAAAQIAELNAPGLQGNAWDLRWVPSELRAKIARVSSILVVDLCRMPGDPTHEPALMDVMMPAAIVAACVVAHSYGLSPNLPTHPQPGRLGVLARLLHWLILEEPIALDTIVRAHANTLPIQQPPIVACLPLRVRDRLIGLAHIMAGVADPLHIKIATVIFIIGAVAAETFESLNFANAVSGSLP